MPQAVDVPVTVAPSSADVKTKVEQDVLKQLGTPPQFHSIKACHLFKNRWRVNVRVVVGEKLTILTSISDSFYVKTDANGNVETSDPEIKTKYS